MHIQVFFKRVKFAWNCFVSVQFITLSNHSSAQMLANLPLDQAVFRVSAKSTYFGMTRIDVLFFSFCFAISYLLEMLENILVLSTSEFDFYFRDLFCFVFVCLWFCMVCSFVAWNFQITRYDLWFANVHHFVFPCTCVSFFLTW